MTAPRPSEKETREFLFNDDLALIDSEISNLIDLEDERQVRKIILIASESACPLAIRQALSTSFSNLYAEGYPSTRMSRSVEKPLSATDHHLSFFRRYYDRRYYKGCDTINIVESLCQQRAAELFATDRFDGPGPKITADQIYVNVQPLSGAAANNAVYNAYVKPGETVMGLHLSAGGHLTHGSPVNRSGMNFNIVPYSINRATGRLDYDQIRDLAKEHKPKMIIAGFSAYPWSIDWQALREAADGAGNGCILLADISHPAGLIVAGQFPSPIGIADVTMTTTHKTLCGPRGALLITTDPARAKAVEMGVFPGEQGGPHINSILAKAVAFKIGLSDEFQTLQRKIKENAAYLAQAIEERGLRLAYGGTDSHLFLIDLTCVKGPRKDTLRGEVASRILDLCDITLNKNTIAGDTNAAHPSGIRIGTTWITQRGFDKSHLDMLADLIHKALTGIAPFHYIGSGSELGRGRIDNHVMEEVKEGVRDLLRRTNPGYPEKHALYPHYSAFSDAPVSAVLDEIEKAGARTGTEDGVVVAESFGKTEAEVDAVRKGCGLADLSQTPLLEVSGERAAHFLQDVLTCDALTMAPGTARRAVLLDASGALITGLLLFRLDADDAGFDRYLLALDTLNAPAALSWLRGLSDGYIRIDDTDVFRKAEGPVVITDLRRTGDIETQRVRITLLGPGAAAVIRETLPEVDGLEDGAFINVDRGGTGLTVSRGDGLFGVGGYTLLLHPVQAKGLWRHILAESKNPVRPVGYSALKTLAAGGGIPFGSGDAPTTVALLESEPGAFDLKKRWSIGRHALPASSDSDGGPIPAPLAGYGWKAPEGPLKRTPLYETHKALTKKDFIIPFAGWEMPVWYTRVSDEHAAVRTTAGLFDVSHMGSIDFRGPLAARFLDFCCTNYATRLADGQAQYSYLLGPDGDVLDDLMVYRRAREHFMVVCNAANEDKVLAWFRAVNSGDVQVSREYPGARFEKEILIRDLKDPATGDDRRIDLAFQGPKSMEVLLKLVDDGETKRRLAALPKSNLTDIAIDGIDVIASRTGYTGEEFGFELFVHPDQAVHLWNTILDAGRPFGVVPTGLGARDSTRCEAGLPLYGHELAGDYDIDPTEAGYGYFVKFHKPFFIGREPLLKRWLNPRKKQIVRFRVTTKMPRTIKPGDPVVERSGRFIGNVTSCTLVNKKQIGQALIDSSFARVNSKIAIFPLPPGGKIPPTVALDAVKKGDRLVVSERAKVISRFPMRK
jgi:glycine cleavage system T protein